LRSIWWCLGIIWGVGALTAGVHVLAVPLLVLAWYVYAAFLSNLGLWFSLTMRNTLHATVCTLGTVFVFVIVCRVAAMNCRGLSSEWLPDFVPAELERLLTVGLFPPNGLYWLCFPYGYSFGNDPARAIDAIRASVLGIAVYAAAACVLWRLNLRRFRQMTFQESARTLTGSAVGGQLPV
jgi:hypothetical protein